MNNYIDAYYQAIKDGSVIACAKTIKVYEMIEENLFNKVFFFNPKKAEHAIRFIENFAHHHEGAMAPQLLKLELWQKALLSAMFGIVDKDGQRQFREIFVVIGRKNGKSILASAIAEYMLFTGEYGARIYFCAPKLKQAAICYNGLFQMIKHEPELNAKTKKRRTDIYVEKTNSSAEPLAFAADTTDGFSPTFTVADEIAAWKGNNGLRQYEVIKSAFGARKEPLLLSISTAGMVNDGPFDELFKRSTAVLNGTSDEKRLLPVIYEIDDLEKWDDINELKKANPNMGVSVSVDYFLDEIAIAHGSIPKKNEFLTKYCNVKTTSVNSWFEADTIMRGFGDPLRLEDYANTYAVAGIDLSMTTDLTAATVCIEKDGRINVFTKFWLPASKLEEASARDQLPYDVYIKRGFLDLSGDNVIDYNDCFNWIRELFEKYKIYILQIGYDQYNALYLTQQLEGYGFHCEPVRQGENLTTIINETEGMMKDGRFNFGDNDLMKAHLFGAALKINAETNRRRLIKVASTVHIDGVAALLDAVCVRANHLAEIGHQLRNEG